MATAWYDPLDWFDADDTEDTVSEAIGDVTYDAEGNPVYAAEQDDEGYWYVPDPIEDAAEWAGDRVEDFVEEGGTLDSLQESASSALKGMVIGTAIGAPIGTAIGLTIGGALLDEIVFGGKGRKALQAMFTSKKKR